MLLELFCWFLATLIVATVLAFGACALAPLLFNLAEFLRDQGACKDDETE